MKRRKDNTEQSNRPEKQPDFVDQMLQKVLENKANGERTGIAVILEEFINELMKRDRDNFLKDHLEMPANGFYKRDLKLTLGELNLYTIFKSNGSLESKTNSRNSLQHL